jgi:uncharacterized protein (UPF0335 family)
VTDAPLQQFVEQIEGVNREIGNLSLDRSELFKSAKQQGVDVKALRRVIAERKKSAAERAEAEEMFRLYWDSLQAAQPVLTEAAQ